MQFERLPNYLRSARKHCGLSQKELARLLGTLNANPVSRYEKFTRTPSLETALLLEAVLGEPVQELFAGLYEQARKRAQERAATLLRDLEKAEPDASTAIKREVLKRIAEVRDSNTNHDL